MRSRPPSALFFLSLVVACASLSALPAQGLLVGSPGPDARAGRDGLGHGVGIRSTSVRVAIVDGVATTTIRQLLHNDGAREATGALSWLSGVPPRRLRSLTGSSAACGADTAHSANPRASRKREVRALTFMVSPFDGRIGG